jgi:N-sulfoglucosamine sulfohydrolase
MKILILISTLLICFKPFASAKPNFVFLLGDDINRDNIGCYGSVDVPTPHIDKLAADGVKFNKAYTSVAMCAPFRQELYSGRTPWRTKAFLNHTNSIPSTQSLPQYLKPLGYRVALAGKTHIGPRTSYPFEFLGGNPNEELFAKASQFIGSCRKEDKPFCIFIASHDAHSPYTTGDRSLFDPGKLTIPPYWIDTPELRQALVPYYAEVNHFDAFAGQIRAFLDDSGLAKNTIFFVCTEQGSGFPFAKWTCFDNGLHTGLVAYGPGIVPKGHVFDELFWLCDLAPTMIEAAGGNIKKGFFDGRSQYTNLTGKPTKVHDFVIGQFSNKGIIDNRERIYPVRCLRDSRYSLIWSPNHKEITSNVTLTRALALLKSETPRATRKGRADPVSSWVRITKGDPLDHPLIKKLHHRPEYALYDLAKDPHELKNLAGLKTHKETFDRLRGKLHEWLKEHDDADPIATERVITTNKSNSGKKSRKPRK